jgi:hypothetical protein
MDKIVTCGVCNKFLLEQVLLPCKTSICKMHIYEKSKNDAQLKAYKCQVCHKDHKIPEDGFCLNQNVVDMMALNLHLNEKTKKAQEIITDVDKVLVELRMLCNDPENFIYEYIHATINKIDLERERIMGQVNDVSDEMLEKLKSLEVECKSRLKSSNGSISSNLTFV